MTTVQDVLQFIETIAPTYMKEHWDKVGLNCGRLDKPVKRILVALDPFQSVCEEAVRKGADLLVTHHALIWTPGFITDSDEQGRNTLYLIENGIACINAHTNLDCAPGGVNDALAAVLGLENVQPLGAYGGMMRYGDVPEQSLTQFLGFVKEQLHCDGLRYCDGGKPVRKVAVGGGSCSDGLYDALQAGCDTFVTSDVKYNGFWDAKEQGLSLIDAGHFHTENPVIAVLAAKISAQFPEIEVKISETHWDCMKYY